MLILFISVAFAYIFNRVHSPFGAAGSLVFLIALQFMTSFRQ